MPIQPGGTAPYAPPRTVIEVIEHHRERGLPAPVTQAVLTRIGVSESLLKRVMQSLRLLDFIDNDGNLTPEFEDLRKVSTPEYKPRLAELLQAVYADVFTIIGDPSGSSFEKIHDAFRTLEPAGQRDRMVTLFLGLLDFAGAWADLPKPKGGTGAATTTTPKKAIGSARTPRKDPPPPPAPVLPPPPPPARQDEHSRTVQLRSGGRVTLVVDVNPLVLKGAERTFFFDLVDLLDGYEAEAKPPIDKGSKPEVSTS